MSTDRKSPRSDAAPRERFERIDRASLTEIAYRSIRDSIVAGRFRMGERVVEKRVAEELAISRAPVREALRRLTEEGLVVERPRHGTSVRDLSAKDFVDIYNMRIAVEGAAMRLVTRDQPPLDDIEKTVKQMRRAAERGRLDELVNLELSVHEQICELSGNVFLANTFRALSALIRMALAVDDATYDEVEKIPEEHVPLLEAIRAGDEDRAVRELETHIVSSVGPVLARLGARPSELLVHPVETTRPRRG